MKNIILPIDFSDTTDTLVEGAVDFAKEIAGKIYLIHVAPADIGFAIGDMGFQYFPEIEKSEISEELAELNEIEKRIKAKKKFKKNLGINIYGINKYKYFVFLLCELVRLFVSSPHAPPHLPFLF